MTSISKYKGIDSIRGCRLISLKLRVWLLVSFTFFVEKWGGPALIRDGKQSSRLKISCHPTARTPKLFFFFYSLIHMYAHSSSLVVVVVVDRIFGSMDRWFMSICLGSRGPCGEFYDVGRRRRSAAQDYWEISGFFIYLLCHKLDRL